MIRALVAVFVCGVALFAADALALSRRQWLTVSGAATPAFLGTRRALAQDDDEAPLFRRARAKFVASSPA
jgi:hypothetical protein